MVVSIEYILEKAKEIHEGEYVVVDNMLKEMRQSMVKIHATPSLAASQQEEKSKKSVEPKIQLV